MHAPGIKEGDSEQRQSEYAERYVGERDMPGLQAMPSIIKERTT